MDRERLTTDETDRGLVPSGLGGHRFDSLLLLAALALALVTVTWGPMAPTASADDGLPMVDEPPWHAWRTETLEQDTNSLSVDTAVGPDGTTWVA